MCRFLVHAVLYSSINFMPKEKVSQLSCKMQDVRDIATMEGVKGKHFFLEADIKGPALKLDNTGKAILTVSIPALELLVNSFEVLNWIITSI